MEVRHVSVHNSTLNSSNKRESMGLENKWIPPLLFSLKQRKELHSRLEACHSLPWVETHSQKRRCKKRGWLNKQVCPFSVRNRSLLLEPVMDVHGAMEDFSLISMQKQCKWPKKWHGTKSLFFILKLRETFLV